MTAAEKLVVARVRGFHGLRGTLRLESLTDRPETRFAVGKPLFVEGSDSPLTVVEAQPDSLGWRVRFAEVTDRTAAEGLRDVYLEAVVAPGEELPRGEFYWHQIVGAAVADVDGTALGEVVDIYRAGGAEVLVVAGPAGELDVPVVRSVVRIFAPARGEIVIDGEVLGLRGKETDQPAPNEPKARRRRKRTADVEPAAPGEAVAGPPDGEAAEAAPEPDA
jgi:16S rRNA processing protein RimM